MKVEKIEKVKILAGYRGDASGYYRTRAPLTVLAKRYGTHVYVGPVAADTAGEYDVVWLQQVADPISEIAVRDHKKAGAVVVYDVDDLLESIPPTWDGYDHWFDVATGRRTERLEFHRRIIRLADVVTCTTDGLAKAIAGSAFLDVDGEKIRVLPNCIVGGQWDTLAPVKRSPEMEGRVVVGWFGTPNHWDDLVEIVDHLDAALDAIDGVLVIIGFPGIVSAFPQRLRDRTYVQDLVGINNFDQVQRAVVTFDIGLAWCTNRFEANRMRSPLKAIQYGAARVPVVASRVVYGDLPEWDCRGIDQFAWGAMSKHHKKWDGSNCGFPIDAVRVGPYGILVDDPDGIAAGIVALADRAEQARAMAKGWQECVWENYTYETQVDRWRDVIMEVLENGT